MRGYSYIQACNPNTLADSFNSTIKESGKAFRVNEGKTKYFTEVPYPEAARDLLDCVRELADAERMAEAQADRDGEAALPDWRAIIESHKVVASLLDARQQWRSYDGLTCMRLSNSGFAFAGRDGFCVSWEKPNGRRGTEYDKLYQRVTGGAR